MTVTQAQDEDACGWQECDRNMTTSHWAQEQQAEAEAKAKADAETEVEGGRVLGKELRRRTSNEWNTTSIHHDMHEPTS